MIKGINNTAIFDIQSVCFLSFSRLIAEFLKILIE